MDRPAALILPAGFVTNTKEIYQEVASYPVIPLEQLWQYWHVYTTTFRKLVDPTAYRLENFWWHVMGSDRRHLSGKALAKIFEEISTGPSFVPLRGPHHTPKPHPIPQPDQNEAEGENGFGASPHPILDHDQARTPNSGKSSVTMKGPTSSSSRPPPPHPILKKSRGPSTSGKRPTARFVSPHESEDEAVNDVDTSSGSTNDSALRIQLQSTPPAAGKLEKRLTPTGRKHVHVASTSASRRRPALPRRQSSQSSGDASTRGLSAKLSPGLRPDSTESRGPTSRAEPDATAQLNSPVLSSKAAGKRPIRASPEKEKLFTQYEVRTKETPRQPLITPPHTAGLRSSPEHAGKGPILSYESSRLRYEVSREPSVTDLSSSMTTQRQHPGATLMVRSQSNIETPQYRPRETGSFSRASRPHGLLSPADKATPSGVTISNVVAQVQFDSANVIPLEANAEPRDIPDSVTLPSRGSSTSLFSPTQPSTSPGIHLGRSKSQLTLLLEREKDRIGDGHKKGKAQRI